MSILIIVASFVSYLILCGIGIGIAVEAFKIKEDEAVFCGLTWPVSFPILLGLFLYGRALEIRTKLPRARIVKEYNVA